VEAGPEENFVGGFGKSDVEIAIAHWW
jgi:hypothetical protein